MRLVNISILATLAGTCLMLAAFSGSKTYKMKFPKGMVYVPSGTFEMETTNKDGGTQNRTVQLAGFYMDQNEVTNQEYREFTDYVRDSIANVILGNFKDRPDGTQSLMMKRIDWNDLEIQGHLSALYVPAELSGTGKKHIDASKLVYDFTVFDYKESVKHPNESQLKFVTRFDMQAYPDTTAWMRLFNYKYNDPLGQQYFCFSGFNNYPVVGVNWMKCFAFCDWRTRMYNSSLKKNQHFEAKFRLPTEAEWEWAAKGSANQVVHIINTASNKVAPEHKNYSAEGGFYTLSAGEGLPNDYGLRNMAGNLAEWTATGIEDASPDDQEMSLGRHHSGKKVTRGGSWMDQPKNIQIGARDFLYADSSNTYTGFRCVFTGVFTQSK